MKRLFLISLLFFGGCSSLQMAHVRSVLTSPQAKMIEAAGQMIAQVALTVAAPEFAWTLPLAVNAASGLLADKTTAQAVATVQQTVTAIAAIPAYKPVAVQIGNAIAAVAPANEEQRVAATQALAQAIADNLPKK